MTVYDDDEETYRIWRSKIGFGEILKRIRGGRYRGQFLADGGYGTLRLADMIHLKVICQETTNEGDRFIEI